MARNPRMDGGKIWSTEFRSLPAETQIFFIYIWCHPQTTALGTLRLNAILLANELAWKFDIVRSSMRQLEKLCLLASDEAASLIYLPGFLQANPPQSPNSVRAWRSLLDSFPRCELQVLIGQQLEAFAQGLPEAFREALAEALASTEGPVLNTKSMYYILFKEKFDEFFKEKGVQYLEVQEAKRSDWIELTKWLKTNFKTPPRQFVDVAIRHWERGQYCPQAARTVTGLCARWTELASYDSNHSGKRRETTPTKSGIGKPL